MTLFQNDFFIGLLSSLISLIIVAMASPFIYPWWTHLTYRPRLTLIDPRTGSMKISAIKNENGAYKIEFGIKNNSHLLIKNLGWHMVFFLPYPIANIQEEESAPLVKSTKMKDGMYLIKVASRKSIDIRAKATVADLWPLTININDSNDLPKEVYYYFSTDYGYIPRNIYKCEKEFMLSEGKNINLEYWKNAIIEVR